MRNLEKVEKWTNKEFLVEFVQNCHPHRTWEDISRLITESKLSPEVDFLNELMR